MKGRILSIQRMSTEDGPGIRTTVFFKGCPLRCAWCHNPESIKPAPEVVFREDRCIGCSTCREVCPQHLENCNVCGRCVAACPSGAREMVGLEWNVHDLANEVAKDRAFFDVSGGGVTLSGGEPTMQPRFTNALAKLLIEMGIQTALDTCGYAREEGLWDAIRYTRIVLYDLKLLDPSAHKKWTGRDNELIIANLKRICEWKETGQWDGVVWVRTPLIPGATDDAGNIEGIGKLVAELGSVVERWDLCPFNPLCRDQYRRLGQRWAFEKEPFQSRERLEELAVIARASGVRPEIVSVGGRGRS